MYKLWDALESAKKLKWVDLTHPLNNDSPYWSGIPRAPWSWARWSLTGATPCWSA